MLYVFYITTTPYLPCNNNNLYPVVKVIAGYKSHTVPSGLYFLFIIIFIHKTLGLMLYLLHNTERTV